MKMKTKNTTCNLKFIHLSYLLSTYLMPDIGAMLGADHIV